MNKVYYFLSKADTCLLSTALYVALKFKNIAERKVILCKGHEHNGIPLPYMSYSSVAISDYYQIIRMIDGMYLTHELLPTDLDSMWNECGLLLSIVSSADTVRSMEERDTMYMTDILHHCYLYSVGSPSTAPLVAQYIKLLENARLNHTCFTNTGSHNNSIGKQ